MHDIRGIVQSLYNMIFICVDALRPSQQFFSHVSWDEPATMQRIKCLAQGHNTVPLVSLDLMTLRP